MSVKVVLSWCIFHGEFVLDLQLTHNEWEAPEALELCPLSWPVADPAWRIRSSHIISSVHPVLLPHYLGGGETHKSLTFVISEWGILRRSQQTTRSEWIFIFFFWTNTHQLRAERAKVRAVCVGMLTDSWGWGGKITIIPLSIKTKTWGNEEKKKTGKYMSSPWETEWKTDEIIPSERQPRNLWEASKFIGLSLLIISLSTAFHVKYNLYTQYKLTSLNTLTKTFFLLFFSLHFHNVLKLSSVNYFMMIQATCW